jgi:hypothetical protein
LPLLAAVVGSAWAGESSAEHRLDARLRLLERARREAVSRAGVGAEAGRERVEALVARLGLGARRAGVRPRAASATRLPVFVSTSGDCRDLEATAFRLQAQVGRVCTGSVEAEGLAALAGGEGIRFVQSSTLLRALPFRAAATPASSGEGTRAAAAVPGGSTLPAGSGAPSSLSGSGVIVAFVDTGVDVFHQDFRKADGTTRIRFLLDLSDPGDVDGDGDLDGAGPYGGTLYTEAQIDAALAGTGSVNEKDTTGHGTHGLSVAAGDDAALPGIAPAADLLVVKATREDGTLGFVSTDVINALAFVDEKAEELGKPYVANLSLGTIVASHDGRSLEEQAIDELFGPGRAGKAAVVAAGNSSENRSSTRFHHFGGVGYVGLAATHVLTVPAYNPNSGQGDDRVLLDLWYRGRDRLTITVTPPGGVPVVATYGSYVDVETPQGSVFVANLGGASLENGDVEAFVLLDDWAGTAPATGNWTVAITGEQVTDGGEYDGWLSDDSVVGTAAPYLSANADNRKLVGKPGTSNHGITVGAFARHDGATRFRTSWVDVGGRARSDSTAVLEEISEFSSPGPTRDGRVKPELSAPGERVWGAMSEEAHPCRSPHSVYRYHGFAECDALVTEDTTHHGFGLLQGTSFAAPVVTGLAARILGTNGLLDAVQVRNVLVNSALTDAFTGAVPNEGWGYGKADLAVGGGTLPKDLRVATDALPDAVVDEEYDFFFTASGGRPPYAWSLESGSLPSGLALDGRGQVSGAPTAAGGASFVVRVTDSSVPVQSVVRGLSLAVVTSRPLEVVTRSLAPAHVGVPYAERLEARGGTAPYTWSLVGGALPAGLELQGDGKVTGQASLLGRYDFTVEARDAASATARASVRVKVTRTGADLWEQLGIVETSVNEVAIDPNDPTHVYCSIVNNFDPAQNAVFESRDNGESWQPISINNNFNDAATWLGVNPATSVPWAIRGDEDVFRYDSGSSTWTDTVACPATSSPLMDALAFDLSGTAYLVGSTCGAESGVVRKSSDQGASWSTVGTLCGGNLFGIPSSVSVARSNPSVLYATRVSVSVSTSVTCRSDDGGATWTEVGRLTGSFEDYLDVQPSATDPLDVVRLVSESFSAFLERSRDGGQTWTRTALPLTGHTSCLRRAASDPAVLLFGRDDGGGGLWRSTDHGLTWTRLAVAGRTTVEVASIAIDPADERKFFVGTNEGLFYTADAGATWALKNRGLVVRGLTGLALSPTAPDELLLTTTGGEPWLTRSAGEKWTAGGASLAPGDLSVPVISAADPGLWLLSGSGRGLYVSRNHGVTWTEVTSDAFDFGVFVHAADADPFDPANLLCSAPGGVWRSTDVGGSWTQVSAEDGTDISFALDVPGRVYAALGWSGLFRSDDGGVTWASEDGATMNVVEPAPSDSRYAYAASSSGAGAVYRRDPGSGAWQIATTGPASPVASLAVDRVDPQVVYAGAAHPGTAGTAGGIYRSTDGGRNYARLPGPLDAFSVVGLATHPTAAGRLFAATAEGGVFRSDDGGASWTHLDRYGSVGELVNVTIRHPSLSSFLLAGTEGYGVQVSSDGGRTFASRVSGLTNLNVNALAFEPGSSTVVYAGTDAGIFKSTDTGNTWAATGLGAGEITDLITDNEGAIRRIWGTVRGQGVAYSADGGATFQVHSSGLASLELTSLELEIVGSIRRIWGTTRGGDGVVYSDDLGQTWKSAGGSGLADRDVTDFAYESSAVRRIWGTVRRIWATTGSGPFYSDNDGSSWTELSLGLPAGAPVSSVSIDPTTNEVMVSLFSDTEGGVYRGGNLDGVWTAFNDGLDELKVNRLTNDNGRVVDGTTKATTFYAATAGDGSYASEVRTTSGASPVIATASLAAGTLHVPYAQSLAVSGGSPPFAWSVPEGTLPPGLELGASTGVVSGEPGRAGVFSFSVQVSDAQGRLDRRPFAIEVVDPTVPTVTSFIPSSGAVGTAVTVSGTGFLGTTAVAFGGVAAAFAVQSATSLQATVPAGARTGPIGVTNGSGTGRSATSFAVTVPAPTISSFTPAGGPVGTVVTIAGTKFTGATAVKFHGMSAAFAVDSATQITATVPEGATSGAISVTTLGGTATSASSFTVIPPPTISSFTPASGPVGTVVTITGTALAGASAVLFHGTSASFTVDLPTQITATVPAGATTGPIQVTTPGGTATSATSFVVPTPGRDFYTVTPCRLVDTRLGAGELGGPVLACGQDRTFTLVGPACLVPSEARALSVNVTVTAGSAPGNLRLYPADSELPGTSTLNYAAGQTRANNAIVGLSADGRLKVRCAPGGTVHFILDVNGYFR